MTRDLPCVCGSGEQARPYVDTNDMIDYACRVCHPQAQPDALMPYRNWFSAMTQEMQRWVNEQAPKSFTDWAFIDAYEDGLSPVDGAIETLLANGVAP